MSVRILESVIPAVAAADGAGVKLRRSLGSGHDLRHDPFLMLDEFFSDDPDDYLAGFPSHPHRGFETVTYMLDGHMQHQDHLGNQGDLGPGDVQWMTAARGIIHSEMPQQTEGRMRGFQLWLNLPAAEKMKPASYQDIPSSQIPEAEFPGGKVRVIAGQYVAGEQRVDGAVSNDLTQPIYLDVHLQAGACFEATLPPGHNAFVYAYEGQPTIADEELPHRAAGLLTLGDTFEVEAEKTDARLLLLAGRPIGEPIAQYGPFVMNTREEIEQAVSDYRDGTLTG